MLKTKDNRPLAVEELDWDHTVSTIEKFDPELAKTMLFIKNTSDYTSYKVSYPYGDKIVNDGKCYLPLVDGESIAFDDPALPNALREDLSYNKDKDPLGMILSKNSELYLHGKIEIQPHSIIHPGYIFGIPKATDEDANDTSTSILELNLNAGSRSLFMLPKISDQIFHGKLKEHFKIELDAPAHPQDHWALFVEIAKKSNSTWRSEVLFFSRKFIEQLESNEWAAVARRLMQIHRTSYKLSHKVLDPWTKTFSEIEREKDFGKYYSMQSVNETKNLIMLAAGITLGFKPATNEESAPIKVITDAYTNIYNKLAKQKHIPIIMEVAKFNPNSKYPIYYSINHSITTQKNLETSKNKSQIARLNEILKILEDYIRAILKDKRDVDSLYTVAQNRMFSFYHGKSEGYKKILNPMLLATEDKRFTNGDCETFPINSVFFTGCIKISQA